MISKGRASIAAWLMVLLGPGMLVVRTMGYARSHGVGEA